MKHFRAGHALIHNAFGEVLLLRRAASNDYKPCVWDIPGGTVEHGETVEDAVIREVREETGLIITVGEPIFRYDNRSELPRRQTIQIVYTCTLLGCSPIRLRANEHSAFRWTKLEDILSFELIEFVLAMALSLLFLDNPRSRTWDWHE